MFIYIYFFTLEWIILFYVQLNFSFAITSLIGKSKYNIAIADSSFHQKYSFIYNFVYYL